MLLLYILWGDWPDFTISGSNEHLQQQLEYTLLKPDCHSWWISKMQSERRDTLEERYAIKLRFKLGKNATETYGMLQTAFDHLAWIEHQFLSGIRDSTKARSPVRDDERCGRSKEVNTPELIGQRVRVRVCKGVQKEIPSEEASNLQIGSVAFPAGQCTSSQLHPCHRLFDQDGIKTVPQPPLLSRPCSL